ncbi:MAG: NUDIX domain-containing protein [Candidatus Lokiarchaeota archaeon]|nr:NUDIX domain-containing protein [Candidatus Lokiarchaeota archaeon]
MFKIPKKIYGKMMDKYPKEKHEDDILKKLKYDLRKYPVRLHVGIGSVIIKDDMLLLIKRKYDPDAGLWAIPGGHLNLGEKAKTCAERETLEETGIKVKATDIAGVIDKIVLDYEEQIKYHYVLINYNSEIIDKRFEQGIPELKPHDDAIGINFVPFNQIKNYDITESTAELLRMMNILKEKEKLE